MPHCPVTGVRRYRDGVCSLLFHLLFIICHFYAPFFIRNDFACFTDFWLCQCTIYNIGAKIDLYYTLYMQLSFPSSLLAISSLLIAALLAISSLLIATVFHAKREECAIFHLLINISGILHARPTYNISTRSPIFGRHFDTNDKVSHDSHVAQLAK